MQLVSLNHLVEALSGKDADSELKTLLLRDNGERVLDLSNARDLASFVAGTIALSFQAKKGTLFAPVKEEAARLEVNSPEWTALFLQMEAGLPLTQFKRNAKGDFVLDGDNKSLPMMVADPGKQARVFQNPYPALSSLDLDEVLNSTDMAKALVAKASHPASLAYAQAAGAFHLAAPRRSPVHSVSEADFLTVQDETFCVSAAFQKLIFLFVARVHVDGKVARLHELYAQEEFRNCIAREWGEHGIDGAALLTALAGYRTAPLSGEPQVFVGDAPNIRRLSVLTPFSLSKEVRRAKETLREQFDAEFNVEARARREAQVEEARALVAELKKVPARQRTAEHTRRLDEATAALAKLKTEFKEESKKKYLPLKSFELLFGGSTPRNLATDLDKGLHSANVLMWLPNPKRGAAAQGKARSHHAPSLLGGRVRLPGELPRCLRADALLAADKKARTRVFEGIAQGVMAPLLELRDVWRADEEALLEAPAGAQGTESRKVSEVLTHLDNRYRAFINGGDGLTPTDRRAVLAELGKQVAARVREELARAYPKTLSSVHDEELKQTVIDFVVYAGV